MDGASPDVTAFILAGGKSTRMGADKAFVMLDGARLGAGSGLARSVTPDVRIVGDAREVCGVCSGGGRLFRGCGPLAGIHAALRASRRN